MASSAASLAKSAGVVGTAAAGGPVGIAAAGAKMTADASAGIIRQIMNAMGHPIYTNASTVTVTHVARNGDIVTRTREHGWNVTVGMVLGVLFITALWEIFAGGMLPGVGDVEGVPTNPLNPIATIEGWEKNVAFNPGNWPTRGVLSLFKGSTQEISVPPSFHAALNQTLLQGMLPILATMQGIGQTGTGTLAEAFQKLNDSLNQQ